MSVVTGQKDYVAFVGGLNTEAGYLSFPENNWKEGDNVVPAIDGSLSRREAIDMEQDAAWVASNVPDYFATTSYVWRNVGGDGDKSIVVIQVGRTLRFYNYISVETTTRIAPDYPAIVLTRAPTNPSLDESVSVTFASDGSGLLLVTSSATEPCYIKYDVTADTLTKVDVTLLIRDLVGIDDGVAVTTRPSVLTPEHKYNLFNAGWTNDLINAYVGPVEAGTGQHPSKAMSWTAGKDPDDNFSRTVLDKIDFGSSPAARGRTILSVFSRDRNLPGIAETPVLPVEVETHRPKACCFFAGRAWYAGIKSSVIGNWVLFSQVALSEEALGKCYQDADPTAEVVTDLIESDGGYIPLQGCGEVLNLEPLQDGVLVFATNGVWFIYGSSNSGFSAVSYRVSKISEYGCISGRSVVLLDNSALYLGYSGLYAVSPDPQSGLPSVTSVTDTSIKTLLVDIPVVCKSFMQGVLNYGELSTMWVYSDDEDNPKLFNRALVLDNRIGSFYTHTFGTSINIRAIVETPPSPKGGKRETAVTVSGEGVVVTGETVFVSTLFKENNSSQWKFLVTQTTSDAGHFRVSMADFLHKRVAPFKYRDWYSLDLVGSPYKSYAITGHLLDPNGASKAGQSMYVTTYLKRTETAWLPDGIENEGSCLMQARWDFTDSPVAGKWGSEQQIYRKRRYLGPFVGPHDDGYPLVITKSKVRGRGKALQLKFENDGDKEFSLVGWTTTYIGNANV